MADTILNSTASTQVLTIGTSASSAIDFIGDSDWWKVNLIYGYRYQVWIEGYYENNGSLLDPFLSVYSGNGTFSFSNDDAAYPSLYSYSYVTPSSTGYLFLAASESGNNAVGTYTITIWQDEIASTASGANIATNAISDKGHLGWQGDISDWYKVTLTAGVQYQFDLIGSAADGSLVDLTLLDPFLVLRNSDGIAIVDNDESGIDHNARIFYTPTTTGTYFLDAQEYGNNAYGTYRLVVNAAPTTGSLTLGASQTGALTTNGEINLYSVTLTAGVSYGFSVDGDTLVDPYLEILNSSGTTVGINDDGGPGLNSFLIYKPTTTGTYFIGARESGNNGTGTYKVQAWQLPSVSIADENITEGNSGSSNLNFAITLSAPSPIDVTIDVATSGTSNATNSVDFTPISRTVTIAAGQTSASFSVAVLGDTKFEPAETFQVLLSNPVNALLDDANAFGLIVDNDNPYALPDDPYVRLQWYLYPSTGINVFPVWNDYTGAGVRVAVFDQGIDPNHADLNDNILVSLGRKASDLSFGGAPVLSTDNHGTMVAGTIAAEQNDQGMVGVAYDAKLVSIYNQLSLSEIPNAFTYAQNFDVLNNSWGFAPQGTSYYALHGNWAFSDNFLNPNFASAGAALENLVSKGRKGLGTVVVQSAGNSFSLGDDTNLHNFQNSQFIITVAATDYLGNTTSYSSPGASVLVSAPGGGGTNELSDIFTSDRVGALGDSTSDYTFTRGTSFSAPIVSGVVALMLEANPNLGYRDVQEILAYSAREISSDNNTWRYNGATNWNGGGLHFDALSHDLGYGLVDALAAVRLAETWTNSAHTAANREQITTTQTVAKSIPDGGGINAVSSANDFIAVTKAIDVERVEVTLNVTHPFIGDLSVLLTSPSGVTSFLLWRPQQNPLSAYGTNQDNIHFTFDTVLNWGESSVGSWLLTIYDNARGDVGTFDSWTLNLIGKPASADDTYIYTNEFSEATTDQASRATLTDAGGLDTLNASAVTDSMVLNLALGGISTIDGRSLTLTAGTLIENAYGGDGGDAITGNDAVNKLYGMRGADTLDGGLGADTLSGGQGNDIYWIDNSGDVVLEDLAEGSDTLKSTASYALTANTEVLVLLGTAALNGSGNELDNTVWGNDGANSIDGGSGNDVLYGGQGNDTFDWTATMRAGNDTMYGGAGNDVFVLGDDDQVIEYANEGTDLIWVDHSYSLSSLPNIENLALIGTVDANLTGNDSANVLRGNNVNNSIEGGLGNDTLDGGIGADTATYSSTYSKYTLAPISTGWIVSGPDGTDTLSNFEFLKFSDQTLPLSNFAPTGNVTISGIATQGQTLTATNTLADVDGIPSQGNGSIAYQWKLNGVAIQQATNASFVLTQAEVGGVVSVVASYTDIHGNIESVSSNATSAVLNVNDLPTGSVSITGEAVQGQILTASNNLADPDGLGTIAYQWKADGININGANASSLKLSQTQVGKIISVVASYTDGGNTIESINSNTTSAVSNLNDSPTGDVTITGEARQGQLLTAANSLADLDGLGTITYQWKADGVNIIGATNSTLSISSAQVGKTITVVASYTDGGGTVETQASSSTTAVLPAGNLSGQIYQWKSHTLMSGAEVSLTGLFSSSQSNSAKPLYEFKNINVNNATHEVSLELWINPTASVNAIDFNMQNVEGQTLTFTQNGSNLSGWIVVDSPDAKGGLAIGGTTLSNALTSAAQLGTITYKSTDSVLLNHFNLLAGSATGDSLTNQQKLTPYTVAVQQKLNTSNASGSYALNSLDSANYSIDVSLPLSSYETGSAISSADALAALKIAVGRSPNLDGSAISPYQLIAADVNQDGKVTSADALAILKMAVKRSDAPVREWLFVNESQDFWDETANAGQGGLTISRTNVTWNKDLQATVTQDTTVNLIAVLKGDVNGSWAGAATGTQSLPNSYFSDLVKKGLGPLATWGVVAA